VSNKPRIIIATAPVGLDNAIPRSAGKRLTFEITVADSKEIAHLAVTDDDDALLLTTSKPEKIAQVCEEMIKANIDLMAHAATPQRVTA
jgi:hypothetical protein